jgi:hypothetical protein
MFLITHWAEGKDELPPLCFLNVSDLTEVCIQFSNESHEEEAIVKMRQRLKLKPYKYKLQSKHGVGGKLIFPQLDR